ncbi:hypothetical protein K3495_g13517 [Podosphaera aphanis]|nr:hypothetical protein K3495_g13517 [Podosphaera aphanis]
MEDGLFCLNVSKNSLLTSAKDTSEVLFSESARKSATELLDYRLGHVGPQIIRKFDASQLKIVRPKDLSNFYIDTSILKNCDVCNSCKEVEKINKGPTSRATELLQVIHTDIWGKCRIPVIFGSHYFVTFTDDISRETEVYLLKNSREVPEKFQYYKEEKELQSGCKMKAIRCDGGAEYKSIKYRGIVRQVSAPYTQHQNGVAERLNRTLVTMARSCYLRNRMPLYASNHTPFEMMTGVTPVLSHLKVWGCICYALIDDKDPQRSGRDKVIVSANVRFLEEKFWDWSKSTVEQFDDLKVLVDEDSEISSPDKGDDNQSDCDSNSDSEPQSSTMDSSSILSSPIPHSSSSSATSRSPATDEQNCVDEVEPFIAPPQESNPELSWIERFGAKMKPQARSNEQ